MKGWAQRPPCGHWIIHGPCSRRPLLPPHPFSTLFSYSILLLIPWKQSQREAPEVTDRRRGHVHRVHAWFVARRRVRGNRRCEVWAQLSRSLMESGGCRMVRV